MTLPTSDLGVTFQNCIDDFNNAVNLNPKNYNNFEPYLSPDDHLEIQRVDDPGQFYRGNVAQIMNYLNTNQVKKFPQFSCTKKETREDGHVTGDGYYWDTYSDYKNNKEDKKIPVRYDLQFKLKGDKWLLITAHVTRTRT